MKALKGAACHFRWPSKALFYRASQGETWERTVGWHLLHPLGNQVTHPRPACVGLMHIPQEPHGRAFSGSTGLSSPHGVTFGSFVSVFQVINAL